MNAGQLIKRIGAAPVVLSDENREISAGYCGDLLSHVMGRAPSGGCWFTVMQNVNVAAVAALADVALTIVCEGAKCAPELIERAREQGLNIAESELDIFSCVKASTL